MSTIKAIVVKPTKFLLRPVKKLLCRIYTAIIEGSPQSSTNELLFQSLHRDLLRLEFQIQELNERMKLHGPLTVKSDWKESA